MSLPSTNSPQLQSGSTIDSPHSQTPQPDELVLLDKLRQGDGASFELLIREYGGYLMTITRRYLQSEADVQDSVQDTFLQALRSVGQFEGRSSIKSWLHRIAVNSALMKIRAQGRRMEELVDDSASLFDERGKRIESEPEIGESVEDQAINNETRKTVRKYIEQMPELSRNLLLLRDIEGYSTEETANLLSISVASVKTGLHRARKLLKKRIEQDHK
ncbi:MAG: sigma-70 family RNA polymerase sigma factor [Acidiferrobacterales bacterium]|nr:sigma-70 family RNA polymerase sigma factor [Acidiferrobacterales bacterium]